MDRWQPEQASQRSEPTSSSDQTQTLHFNIFNIFNTSSTFPVIHHIFPTPNSARHCPAIAVMVMGEIRTAETIQEQRRQQCAQAWSHNVGQEIPCKLVGFELLITHQSMEFWPCRVMLGRDRDDDRCKLILYRWHIESQPTKAVNAPRRFELRSDEYAMRAGLLRADHPHHYVPQLTGQRSDNVRAFFFPWPSLSLSVSQHFKAAGWPSLPKWWFLPPSQRSLQPNHIQPPARLTPTVQISRGTAVLRTLEFWWDAASRARLRWNGLE